jgi:hypothetical protein
MTLERVGYQKSWLEKLLNKSLSLNWCVYPYCTTCCCQDLRSNFVILLSREIGFQLPDKIELNLRLDALSSDDMTLCFKEIVKALEELPKSNLHAHDHQSIGVILKDLYALRLAPLLSGQPYGDIINGTWVGERFSEMEEAASCSRENRRKHDEYNSQASIEKRKEKKRIEKQEKVDSRLEKSSQHKLEIKTFLKKFSQCDKKSRLLKLASQELDISIDAIPLELIPIEPELVSCLSKEEKNRLADRIGRRRGFWAKFKELLKE